MSSLQYKVCNGLFHDTSSKMPKESIPKQRTNLQVKIMICNSCHICNQNDTFDPEMHKEKDEQFNKIK